MPNQHVIADGATPLEVYVAFDFLTVAQHARILSSVDGVYESLLGSVANEFYWMSTPLPPPWSPRQWGLASALCTSSAETGSSIKFGFQVSKRWLPSMRYENDALQILFPTWTAIAFAAGSILTFGLDRWEQYLRMQKTNLEIAHLEAELKKARVAPWEALDAHTKNELQSQVDVFQSVVCAPNIQVTQVNGIPVEEKRSKARP